MSSTMTPPDLTGYLGRELAADLHRLANAYGLRITVPPRPRRPDTGYTGAVLATLVIEDDRAASQVMMKACSSPDWESGQYLQAHDRHPAFSQAHLIGLRSRPGPWPRSDGGLILFQDLAGDGRACLPLSALPGERLAGACRHLVTSLLTEWNDRTPPPRRRTVPEFLREQIGPEAALSRGSVRRWAEAAGLIDSRIQWISTAEDGDAWPNPVAIAFGRFPAAVPPFACLVGNSHGDLHLENVLVPVGRDGRPDLTRFTMIDLATYSPTAPLTGDPTYLMLSAIALRLPHLPEDRRTALLHRVVRPVPASAASDPGDSDPAFQVVAAIYHAMSAAIEQRRQGWSGDWSTQYLLSTLALALLFTTYQGLGPAGRWWFFRLAARAGRELVGREPAVAQTVTELGNPFREPEASAAPAQPVRRRSDPDRPARRSAFGHTAHAWRLASARGTAAARESLRQAREEAVAEPVRSGDARVRAIDDLLADTIHILGATDELTLELRYDLAFATSQLAGRAAEARRLFETARVECERVLGAADPRTDRCRRARDSTTLARRARTGE